MKNSVTLSHARVIYRMKHYRIRPFSTWGEKRAPLSATKVRANQVCNTEFTTQKHNLSAPTTSLSGGLRKTSAQCRRATIESLSSPILKAATTNCEKCIFSSFFLLSLAFRSTFCTTKTRHRDSFKGHREIKRKSLCLADVTPTNHRDAQHLYVQLKLNNMTKQKTMIEELKYRIARYRSMGNGVMCQSLNNQLRALKAEQ